MFWVPERHLQSFTGTLQVDAYADFHHLYNIGRISEAACWAHARRRFHDSMPRTLTKITEAIECIAALYAIEKAIRGSTPELRRKVRQTRAAPLLANMHAWLEDTLAKLSKKSDTAAAIRYALSRWRARTRYLNDDTLEIDNNAAERACVSLRSAGRTSSSPVPARVSYAPPRCTPCSAPPSSTASIRRSISSMSSNASPTIPSAASRNCCSGMCR